MASLPPQPILILSTEKGWASPKDGAPTVPQRREESELLRMGHQPNCQGIVIPSAAKGWASPHRHPFFTSAAGTQAPELLFNDEYLATILSMPFNIFMLGCLSRMICLWSCPTPAVNLAL